jgi:protein required for attachment to host cells
MPALILIANSECGLFIDFDGHNFKVIEEREHPQSKEKVEHLVSDRPGRTFSRMSTVRHSLGEGQDVLRPERQKFARELVKFVQERHHKHPFPELWIVTGPKFLGELRTLFHRASHPYSIVEIHKELCPKGTLSENMEKILSWIEGVAPRKRANKKSHLKLHFLN